VDEQNWQNDQKAFFPHTSISPSLHRRRTDLLES
jgi:hypothetical protein